MHDRSTDQDPGYVRLAMSVMNEQLQRLTPPVCRPNVTLQILALGGPGLIRGEPSAILCLGPDRGAACQGVAGTGHLRNDHSPGGGKGAYPRRITCQVPAGALLGPHRCKELTPKTTESHWSGGQREP